MPHHDVMKEYLANYKPHYDRITARIAALKNQTKEEMRQELQEQLTPLAAQKEREVEELRQESLRLIEKRDEIIRNLRLLGFHENFTDNPRFSFFSFNRAPEMPFQLLQDAFTAIERTIAPENMVEVRVAPMFRKSMTDPGHAELSAVHSPTLDQGNFFAHHISFYPAEAISLKAVDGANNEPQEQRRSFRLFYLDIETLVEEMKQYHAEPPRYSLLARASIAPNFEANETHHCSTLVECLLNRGGIYRYIGRERIGLDLGSLAKMPSDTLHHFLPDTRTGKVAESAINVASSIPWIGPWAAKFVANTAVSTAITYEAYKRMNDAGKILITPDYIARLCLTAQEKQVKDLQKSLGSVPAALEAEIKQAEKRYQTDEARITKAHEDRVTNRLAENPEIQALIREYEELDTSYEKYVADHARLSKDLKNGYQDALVRKTLLTKLLSDNTAREIIVDQLAKAQASRANTHQTSPAFRR